MNIEFSLKNGNIFISRNFCRVAVVGRLQGERLLTGLILAGSQVNFFLCVNPFL